MPKSIKKKEIYLNTFYFICFLFKTFKYSLHDDDEEDLVDFDKVEEEEENDRVREIPIINKSKLPQFMTTSTPLIQTRQRTLLQSLNEPSIIKINDDYKPSQQILTKDPLKDLKKQQEQKSTPINIRFHPKEPFHVIDYNQNEPITSTPMIQNGRILTKKFFNFDNLEKINELSPFSMRSSSPILVKERKNFTENDPLKKILANKKRFSDIDESDTSSEDEEEVQPIKIAGKKLTVNVKRLSTEEIEEEVKKLKAKSFALTSTTKITTHAHNDYLKEFLNFENEKLKKQNNLTLTQTSKQVKIKNRTIENDPLKMFLKTKK